MALINHAKKEINAKLVYFGPAGAGKSTNLNFIYRKLKPDFRGTFKAMNVQNNRMLFFDFTPSGQGTVNGYAVRFHIYTIQGEVSGDAAWKTVLKGVDGLMLVADSAEGGQAANRESHDLLEGILAGYGSSLAEIPAIVQANRRDVPDPVSPAELARLFGAGTSQVRPAVAQRGEGVLESLFELVRMVLKNLRESGLELGRVPEQSQTVAEEPEEPVVPEPVPEEPVSLPARAEESAEEAVSPVSFAGGATLLPDGRLAVPLVVSVGGESRRVTLTLALDFASDRTE